MSNPKWINAWHLANMLLMGVLGIQRNNTIEALITDLDRYAVRAISHYAKHFSNNRIAGAVKASALHTYKNRERLSRSGSCMFKSTWNGYELHPRERPTHGSAYHTVFLVRGLEAAKQGTRVEKRPLRPFALLPGAHEPRIKISGGLHSIDSWVKRMSVENYIVWTCFNQEF